MKDPNETYHKAIFELSATELTWLDTIGRKLGTKTRAATVRRLIKERHQAVRNKPDAPWGDAKHKKKDQRSDWDRLKNPTSLGEYLQARENLNAKLRLTRGED